MDGRMSLSGTPSYDHHLFYFSKLTIPVVDKVLSGDIIPPLVVSE